MKRILSCLLVVLAMSSWSVSSYAQTDPDEAYDPFSDYSEFDEASDEEADINFFKNGRFFTAAMVIGPRGFTEGLGKVYNDAPMFGIQLSYFFDLRLALMMGLTTGDSAVNFTTNANTYSGNVSITTFNMDLKYYFNTQNVTRGLADLNPFILGGFSQVQRSYSFSSLSTTSRDSTMATDLGVGIEIPLMRRKAYTGVQATYHYISFPDENKDLLDNGGTLEKLNNKFNGDMYDVLFMIGMNF
ncbi:MAG: outer membrane beta-barrel protein [Bdellovibrionota bacterium]